MNLNEKESIEFLETLFPGGLKNVSLQAGLCPQGWEKSPLFEALHPSQKQCYDEHLSFAKRMKELQAASAKGAGENVAQAQEVLESFDEFVEKNPVEELILSSQEIVDELAHLIGLCFWDTFSNNHEVITAEGKIVDLGSFRGSAGTIADFVNQKTTVEEPFDFTKIDFVNMDQNNIDFEKLGINMDYMDYYMGTTMIAHRVDLAPIYELIFRRIQAYGGTWRYAFPRIHLIDFGGAKSSPEEDYEPSASFQKSYEEDVRKKKVAKMKRDMDKDAMAAKRRARAQDPPTTVQAFMNIFDKFPSGWPPDPFSPE